MRSAYNILRRRSCTRGVLDIAAVESVIERKVLRTTKQGRSISTWFRRCTKHPVGCGCCTVLAGEDAAGREDRMYLARRLVRMAVEDIGFGRIRGRWSRPWRQQARHFLEFQRETRLARSPCIWPSRPIGLAYRALNKEITRSKTPQRAGSDAARNAPTKAMKEWGTVRGYQHAHQFEDALNNMSCLPENHARIIL